MRRVRTTRRRLAALMAALAVTAAACGVEPTRMFDAGPAPVISGQSTRARIYLVRDGHLEPTTVAVGSQQVDELMTALFRSSTRPADGLTSALAGLTLSQVQLVRYSADPSTRNDPDNTLSLRIRVFVSGWKMSRMAMAQITCTARLRPEIWAVEIARNTPGAETGPLQVHTCREYWDLAPKDGQLPP
jgi:hypothetical protein